MSSIQAARIAIEKSRIRLRQMLSLMRMKPFDTETEEGRSDERHRRLLLTTLAAALGKAVSVVTLLITVPLTLHYLGVERYGMWGTMSSFIALLTFADFGISNGLLNRVSAAHGRNYPAAIQRYVSSAFFILTIIALLIATLFAVAYPFVPWHQVFNVTGDLARHEAGPAIAVLTVCFVLNLPLSIVQKVQIGLQQGFTSYLWNCLASLLALSVVLLTIHLRAGLPWLVLALVGAPLAVSLLNSLTFFGVMRRDLAPRPSGVSRNAIAAVTRTGLLFVALQTVVASAYGSDNIIIAHTLGAAHVAEYAVPAQMFTLVTTVLAVALGPLWPAYGEAISRQDNTWVRKTLVRSFLTAISFATVASLTMLVAAPAILKIWIGTAVQPPFALLLGLSLWRIIDAGGNAITVYLNGANLLRFQLVVLACSGFFAIVLKIALIGVIGISGIAWAAILSYLAASIPTLLYLRRRLTT